MELKVVWLLSVVLFIDVKAQFYLVSTGDQLADGIIFIYIFLVENKLSTF